MATTSIKRTKSNNSEVALASAGAARWDSDTAEDEPVLWFVAAPRSYYAAGDRAAPWTTHAKTVGTMVTACGVNATSWLMLWEYRFPTRGFVACQACLEVVIYGTRERNENRATAGSTRASDVGGVPASVPRFPRLPVLRPDLEPAVPATGHNRSEVP